MMRAASARPSVSARVLRRLADLAVGGLLCTNPVTALIALGWISRQAGAHAKGAPRPGWILGLHDGGMAVRLLGGLAANIRTGIGTLAGLLAWTLPFTLLWLFSWWAGWENSFNKGYEQAWIGPVVFLVGVLISLPLMALLPHAAAHAAVDGRLAAFFHLRSILRQALAAGWRGLRLAVFSVLAALPLFAFTAFPVFVEAFIPGFADLPPDRQAEAGQTVALVAALCAFAALWTLRLHATRLAMRGDRPGRLGPVWLALTAMVWAALPVLILVAQFLNYAPQRWLMHPLILLPWPG